MLCGITSFHLERRDKMKVAWFSTGISSLLATYLVKDSVDKIIYNHIDDQHFDSLRFIKDSEELLEKKIDVLQSPYKNVDSVCRAFQMLNIRGSAICTNVLKKRLRKEWELEHQHENLTYVWGMDSREVLRAYNLNLSMPEFNHEFPLIDNHISKEKAHTFINRLGLKRPEMYNMGYRNNNCIGCVKGGMGYWNKIRKDFPDVFESRCKLENDLGFSILKEKGAPLFLSELNPKRGNFEKEIQLECGIMCEVNL